jgi:hypothetical protein
LHDIKNISLLEDSETTLPTDLAKVLESFSTNHAYLSDNNWSATDHVTAGDQAIIDNKIKKDVDWWGYTFKDNHGERPVIDRPPIDLAMMYKCTTNPDMPCQIFFNKEDAKQLDHSPNWERVSCSLHIQNTIVSDAIVDGVYNGHPYSQQ